MPEKSEEPEEPEETEKSGNGRIVFIESSDIGVGYSGRAARALGYEPLFLCDLSRYQADPRAQLGEFEVVDGPTDSAEDILRTLDRFSDIRAVTSLADTRLRVARTVAEHLGVAGLDPAVTKLKDKAEVQRLVPEFSPRSLEFGLSALPLSELRELFTGSTGVILKPVDGAGGLGLVHLRDEGELAMLGRNAVLAKVPPEFAAGRWIAQSFATGELVSVEGFVARGVPRFLGISKRRKVAATESASTFPADASLDPAARATARTAVERLVERSGFRNGYFHIEFIVRGPECTLIDANVGRLGGGSVGEQVAIAYGLAPIEVYKHVLITSIFSDAFAGQRDIFAPPEGELRETFAILYGLEKGGRLRDLRLPKYKRFFHTQILGAGAEVSPMGRDDWSWIGILSGHTADTLRAAEQIEIVTDDGVFKPFY